MDPVERQVDADNAHDLDAYVGRYVVYHVADNVIDHAVWFT